VNANLSGAQFGSGLPSSTPVRQEPRSNEDNSPLPYTAGTNTSASQAAAWRKPRGLLSLTTATRGTIFKPFG
jgi:hypothetical protein